MSGSGILDQAVKLKRASKSQATHFALCNGDYIRYLIAVKGGKKWLRANVATYSNKLALLMKLINYLPFSILQLVNLGYFVEAQLHLAVQECFKKTKSTTWNMIVGTYDEKQKLVLQCFSPTEELATFIKIGNIASSLEMLAEMKFLAQSHSFTKFNLPVLLYMQTIGGSCPFNIQMTKEFVGKKVEPVLTDNIYRIYKELAGEPELIDGIFYEFSHGDFAPWNLKEKNAMYTVFDWEYCGRRIRGFDLIYFLVVVEVMLNKKSHGEVFDIALDQVKRFEPEFEIDREKFFKEFSQLRL